MNNEKPSTSPGETPMPAVVPLPTALYESNGVIFELYRGGQPYRPLVIRWERMKTVTVTRAKEGTFSVDIHQGRRDLSEPQR